MDQRRRGRNTKVLWRLAQSTPSTSPVSPAIHEARVKRTNRKESIPRNSSRTTWPRLCKPWGLIGRTSPVSTWAPILDGSNSPYSTPGVPTHPKVHLWAEIASHDHDHYFSAR